MTLEELATIVEKMPGRYRLMVLLASWAALRFNELIGLRRRGGDLKARTVHVRRGVNVVDAEWIVTGPKGGSLRDVALLPHILDAVRVHLRDHARGAMRCCSRPAMAPGSCVSRAWSRCTTRPVARPDARTCASTTCGIRA